MSLVNEDRPLTHEQVAFKNAFGRAIERVGSARRMAELIGYSDGQVSRWKRHEYDEHVPAALHSKIDAAAGYPCMLETAALLAGYSIRRDEVEPSAESLFTIVGSMAEQSGRAVVLTAQAKADGQICLRELNMIEAEGKTIIENTTRWMEAARANHEAGQGTRVVRMTGGERQ